MTRVSALAMGAFAILGVLGEVSMAIEEPEFTVESKTDLYEIRQYPPVLVAETVVSTAFEDAGNSAFRLLAGYIFGNNQSQTKVAMTAPVTQQPSASQKIAMTAPVAQQKTSQGYVVQFMMPKSFTLETLPKPNDPRVALKELPAKKVAVYRYSGSWSEERFQEKLAEFTAALRKDGRNTVGEPTFARFNSPWALWFLRRNEIWIEIQP